GPVGAALGAWLVAGSFVDLWMRSGRGEIKARLGRMTRLPRAEWGKAVAHGGMGILIFGICALLSWETEDIRVAKIGDSFKLGGYEVTLDDVHKADGPNYTATIADMTLRRDGRVIDVMHPEKRFYPVAGQPTTQAAIRRGIWGDVYLVVGDPQKNGGYALRSYLRPFADWIWAGAILMGLGGALSLSDRRYRIAAGARKAARPDSTVPAE
ncbi:heme lyase NrfEFG subunit NrfE, partial [Thioclava sp. BHET1]